MNLPGWIKKQLRKRARVYIMPTRMGGYFNGLLFLMFLLSIGYNNNLLLIFTLLLFGLNLMWVIQTHFHLHALKLHSLYIQDGHAEESLDVTVNWKKTPSGPHNWDMILESDKKSIPLKISLNGTLQSSGNIILPNRGSWGFTHLKVMSERPFGLYKTWIYFPVNVTAFAYPKKLKHVPEVFKNPGAFEGENPGAVIGPHDVKNLAPYQGEESRKISWKHYARSGELVVKEGEELIQHEVHFKISESAKDKESELSKIATQMVHCSRTDVMFSLETPVKKTATGVSSRHLAECLRELAVC